MEERLRVLEEQVRDILTRLDGLESRPYGPAPQPGPELATAEGQVPAEMEPALTLQEGALAGVATNLGRTLLIFGGAYFLRALTDFGLLPPVAGVLMGAAYALLWLFLALRSGSRQEPGTTPIFFGIASVLLTLPILAEATTRFELLTAAQAAVTLTLYSGLALWVAARTGLRSLAWVVTTTAALTALVLLRATHEAAPFCAFLLLLGPATLWLVYSQGWKGLQWLGALSANTGVAVLALLSQSERWTVAPDMVFFAGLTLLTVYPASFAVRSHILRRTVGAFEVAQGLLVIGIVFWAGTGISDPTRDWYPSVLGIACLLMGAASYFLAFTPETRSVRGRNFFFYSTVGLALVVGGSAVVMEAGKAAAAWSLLAVLMAIFSGRYGRVTLSLQCTLLLLAAASASGVLSTGFAAFASSGLDGWPATSAWQLVVAVATVACLFIPVAQHSERWGVLAGLPQLIVLALSVWAVGGLMVAFAAPLLARVPGAEADLAALAALRTVVLTLSAITLALSSRHRRWPEARWLVYPLLLLVGLKLVFEDFPSGRPLTLFIALGLLGGALIVVARLLRRPPSEAQS